MSAIVYNPNIPANQKSLINVDQVNFLNNFSSLYNSFLSNHVPLDAVSGAGNHTIIQLLEQDENAQFQTDAGEISVYVKNISGQTDQIFLRYQGNATEFAYTVYQIYALKASSTQTPFFTFLPGRVLIYFGSLNVTLNNPQTGFQFNLFPAIATNIITMNFCPIGTNPAYSPYVTLQQPDNNGIYKTINLFSSLGITTPTQLFYTVLVNI